jgi:hypothetical protein
MMGVRNGRNYIVSVSITPEMHEYLNSKKKGYRSAFLRRAIYNAEKYDNLVKAADKEYDEIKESRDNLLTLFAYQQSRLNRIISTGEDIPDFVEWVLSEGSYYPDLKKQSWRDARDVIEGLTHHIDGLSNVLPAFGDTGDGQIE